MKLFPVGIMALCVSAVVGCKPSTSLKSNPVREAADPTELSAEAQAAWESVQCLQGGWGDPNFRYERALVPQVTNDKTCSISAWRGERASAQLLLWSAAGAKNVTCEVGTFHSDKGTLPASIARAHFLHYTIAAPVEWKDKYTLCADMLGNEACLDMDSCTTRPVWVSIEVPADATPGTYRSALTVSYDGGEALQFPLELNVSEYVLPSYRDWAFHLDLWQHPSAVARVEGVEMWSNAHFAQLEKTMQMLAKAGQKVITATLNKDPWNHQCYDAYEDMIRWTRHADGTWSYDYQVFDRWVSLMLSLGIDKMINCYSMVPWNCELHYMDEALDSMITVKAEPGTKEFEEMWTPFLIDFKQHQSEKGWLEITNIAMDERSPQQMDAAVKVLTKCAPEMGFAIADNHQVYKRYSMMRDVCVAQPHKAAHEDIVSRRAQGFNTTFYVCCWPMFPNTFTFSNPYEAELLGWYSVACDYDGMLRWAYNSWPECPEYDSRYGNWASGDTYLVYPHQCSSVRFERLIDGIENVEKVRVLRSQGVDISPLEAILEEIRTGDVNNANLPWHEVVNRANDALNQLSF